MVTEAVLQRWAREAAQHDRHGDYAWLAEQVPGQRVVEIGCGAAYSTLALGRRGKALLVLESDATCVGWARERLADVAPLTLLEADLFALGDAERAVLAAFAPDSVVCWLAGGDETSPAMAESGLSPYAQVVHYRERLHRAVAELAACLPSVNWLHLADRTAFPWKMKEVGRETLAMMHRQKTFAGLPISAEKGDALYRKLDPASLENRGRNGPPGVVPVLGALLARVHVAPSLS